MNTPFLDVSPMTDRERRLLDLVWRYGLLPIRGAADLMGCSPNEAGQASERLVKAMFIQKEHHGGRKIGFYRVTELGKYVAANKVTVYLVRHGRRRTVVPVMHMAGQRVVGETVENITDLSGYLNERTVQRKLRAAGMNGTAGRPRKGVSA